MERVAFKSKLLRSPSIKSQKTLVEKHLVCTTYKQLPTFVTCWPSTRITIPQRHSVLRAWMTSSREVKILQSSSDQELMGLEVLLLANLWSFRLSLLFFNGPNQKYLGSNILSDYLSFIMLDNSFFSSNYLIHHFWTWSPALCGKYFLLYFQSLHRIELLTPCL